MLNGLHSRSLPTSSPATVRSTWALIAIFIAFNILNCLPQLRCFHNEMWLWVFLAAFTTEIVLLALMIGHLTISQFARFLAAIVSLTFLLATQTMGFTVLPQLGTSKDALQIVPFGIGVFVGAKCMIVAIPIARAPQSVANHLPRATGRRPQFSLAQMLIVIGVVGCVLTAITALWHSASIEEWTVWGPLLFGIVGVLFLIGIVLGIVTSLVIALAARFIISRSGPETTRPDKNDFQS
jgi:hypothetical protein